MNKLKLYTDKKIVVAANPVTKGIGIAYNWGVPKLWGGIKWLGGKLVGPATYVGSGAGLLYYSAKDEPSTNSEGLDEDEISDVNANLQNTIADFGIKYSAFYKDLYEKENIYSDIIKYSAESQTGSGGDPGIINSKFMIGLDEFLDKFLADNISGGKNPFGLSEKQAVVYNEKLINFVEKIRKCSRTDLFLKKLDGQLNSDGGVNQIMLAAHENDPDSINELKGQSRITDDEDFDDKKEDRMSIYERNRAEAHRLKKEMDAEDKALEAELRLMEATRPESKKLDGGRIVDNLNWYIRLEQKIEDEGSGLFGMYNKFKKLPIFSFVRAQSRDAKFSKDSRQVKRRYSSILMSKSDPKYRTEIFEAPEYDMYPYYIKQRILILKFLKNELGSKFDSIYNQKMDEIESSNYADDGEFSIMPNKLAKALNKIIKKAGIDDLKAPSEEFRERVTSKQISELKSLYSSQQKYNIDAGTIYKQYKKHWKGNSNVNYTDKLKIFFEALGVRELNYDQMYSCIVSMASKGYYKRSIDSGSNKKKLYEFFDNIHKALKSIDESSFKAEETPAPEPNSQEGHGRSTGEVRTIEEPIQEISDEKNNIRALKMAMNTEGYVEGSVRKTPEYSNLQNLGVVTIDNEYFISKWNGSKEVFRYEELEEKNDKFYSKRGGLYYYWIGIIKVSDGGSVKTKNVFMTNRTEQISEVRVEPIEESNAGSATLSGIFVNTSSFLSSKEYGSDSKRTLLLDYDYNNDQFSEIKSKFEDMVISDANLKLRYPLRLEKAVLINGKESQLKEDDDFRIDGEKFDPSARKDLMANTVYTLSGGLKRLSFGKNFWTLELKGKETSNFFETIYTYLLQIRKEKYMNPGVLYYLSKTEANSYLKSLALLGFFKINQGFLVPEAFSEKEMSALVSKLETLYDYALQKSSN